MSAVYFVQPTANNFQAIIRDFQEKALPCTLGCTYSSTVPPAGLELLKSAPGFVSTVVCQRHIVSCFPWRTIYAAFSAESLNLTFGQDVTTNPIKSRVRSEHYDLIIAPPGAVSAFMKCRMSESQWATPARHIYELFAQKLTAFVQENPGGGSTAHNMGTTTSTRERHCSLLIDATISCRHSFMNFPIKQCLIR